jgi:hypothetical protein
MILRTTLLIALDFSKAFDKVPFNRLLIKLIENNFPKWFVAWVAAYLDDRKQCVKISNSTSQLKVVRSGVPQGSVIGPALFTFYATDLLPNSNNSTFIKYADDTCIVMRIPKGEDPVPVIHNEINRVEEWSKENFLELNKQKTKCMAMGYSKHKSEPAIANRHTLNFVNSIRVLGLHIDNLLTWKEHIDYIIKKQSTKLYILRTMKKFNVDTKNLFIIYTSIIKSIGAYSSQCFVGLSSTQNARLERMRKRSHKIVCGDNCNKISCIFHKTIHEERTTAAVKLFQKIAANPKSLTHKCIPNILSHTKKYVSAKCRTNWKNNSFFIFVARHLNAKTKRS